MSRYDRIPTPVEVTLLDLSTVEVDALDYLRREAQVAREHGQPDKQMPEKVRAGEAWGVVETSHGLYALCTEGVGPGHPITDDDPLLVDIFVERHEEDGDKTFIAMFPSCQARLKPEDLREKMTGEKVNLAEYVRTFGARLESNYESWRQLLETAA